MIKFSLKKTLPKRFAALFSKNNTFPKDLSKKLTITQSYFVNKFAFCSSTNNTFPNNSNNPNKNNEDNENNENNEKNNKNLKNPIKKPSIFKTFPIKNMKIKMTPSEEKLAKKYVLFSSNLPIIPYNESDGVFKTGKLIEEKLKTNLAYLLLNEDNEIYQIGVLLDKKISKSVKKMMKESQEKREKELQSSNIFAKTASNNTVISTKIFTKNQNFRIKIFEIEVTDNGIFCTAVPYKDRSLGKEEKNYNLNYELNIIKEMISSIKLSVSYERIEVFDEINLNKINFNDMNNEQLDELCYKIANDISKVNQFTKDNTNILIQSLLESQSIVERVIIVRKKLEQIHSILEIVNKNFKEIERFGSLDRNSSEYNKLSIYLDDVFSIPWQKFSPPFFEKDYAKSILDTRIFGLEKVKERILEMISVNKLKLIRSNGEEGKGFVILLYGPPGTGKTSIAKCIADSLKREQRFISFAGVSDPHFVKGHRRTYVDSQPGVFIKELIKAQTMNPVFILDEIDKFYGFDPYYSLLEILNPEESHNFVDHYLDIKVDFSKVIFILTANQILTMLEPLKNRLEIIEINPYIDQEKLEICKNYFIPTILKENCLFNNNIIFNDNIINQMIKGGVRELRRCFEKIARKYATDVVENISKRELVDEEKGVIGKVFDEDEVKNYPQLDFTDPNIDSFELLKNYLGPPIFDADLEERSNKQFSIGIANVLTVGGFIGHVLMVEAVYDNSFSEKKGHISSSGNLQNILQESINIARINAYRFLTPEQTKELSTQNVHIHFLQGSSPKDGPSAGISICVSFLSLILKKQIPANLAMTGELSLNGEVCKIGGIQAKLIAAKGIGINHIIIPYSNMGEVLDISKLLLDGLTIYFVTEFKQIYNLVFNEKEEEIQKALEDVVILKNNQFLGKKKFESLKSIEPSPLNRNSFIRIEQELKMNK